jgi:hypothetical protein
MDVKYEKVHFNAINYHWIPYKMLTQLTPLKLFKSPYSNLPIQTIQGSKMDLFPLWRL